MDKLLAAMAMSKKSCSLENDYDNKDCYHYAVYILSQFDDLFQTEMVEHCAMKFNYHILWKGYTLETRSRLRAW